MVNWNIATGKEQPLNRTGFENVQVTGEYVQGIPVGIDDTGSETELVEADAAPDASNDGSKPITAVGVLLPNEVIPENVKSYTKRSTEIENPWDDVEAQIYKEDRTIQGDRATVVFGGIEMVNDDRDTDWSPTDPIYLAEGGGFTDTKPSTTGAAQQVLGVALTDEDMGPAEGFDQFNEDNADGGRPRLFLDVDWTWDTAA